MSGKFKRMYEAVQLKIAYEQCVNGDRGEALSKLLGIPITYNPEYKYEFMVNGEPYFEDDTVIEVLLKYAGLDLKQLVKDAFDFAKDNLKNEASKQVIAFLFEPGIANSHEYVQFYKAGDIKLSTWDNGPSGTYEDVITEYFT